MRAPIIAAALAFVLAPLSSCGKNNDDKSLTERAEDEARSLKDRAADLGDRAKDLGGRAVDEVKDLGSRAKDEAGGAMVAIEPYVDQGKAGVEAAIVKGKQIGDKVEAMSERVGPTLDSGVIFRPIYQRLDDAEANAELDALIKGMPRTEVIDGVTIGFRAHSKRQYLVTWRKGDHLVGFVYTSLTDIAIEAVIKKTPELIGLINRVI